ncbi:MAG TPA: glycerate kinase [Casimicrobiaceae bacterium]|nr:glycerate kinase [Casimicrobiaceae bacterium]
MPSPIVVVAVDSFKGSLAAPAATEAIARGVLRAVPGADVRARPMADGGEGTLDALLAASPGSRRLRVATCGATGAAIETPVGRLADGEGVVEIAQVVGLTDAATGTSDVRARDTRGVGRVLRALIDDGCRAIAIGLGGSSTNDGGAGLLAELGVRFLDAEGRAVAPTPEGLARLARVDAGALDPRVGAVRLTIMSDVDNPLTGARGATAVFGPQKGVAAADIAALDRTLAHYAAQVEAALGCHAASKAGAGAAGGLGFALQLLGARFASGAETVADLNGLDAALDGADWAITGEGRSDAQTLMLKAPSIVARRARARGVPVALLSGAIDSAALPALDAHFDGCFALPPGPAALADSLAHAQDWLDDRAFAMARLRFCARR